LERLRVVLLNLIGLGHLWWSGRNIHLLLQGRSFNLAERIVFIVMRWTMVLLLRIGIWIVSFKSLEEFKLSFTVLLLQFKLELLYLEFSFLFLDLSTFCLAFNTLNLLLEHLSLVVDLVPHLLDFIRKHLQLLIIAELLRLPLSLLAKKLARNICVEAFPLRCVL
jgi:hypothetical protein